ncbi:MAG TPA: hypothetical protein PLV37_01310 [Bacillota bacterium]|nr:hypothetical protein [Bacillota bacterium]
MNRFDNVFGGILIGIIIPILTLCTFWWGSYLLDLYIQFWAIFGIILGIVIDIIFLSKLLRRFYYLSTISLALLYLFYSIGMFGFFMGVPIFNIVLGIIAGIYIGRRMKVRRQEKEVFQKSLRQTAGFSFVVLLIICLSSAFIAITDPYTGANLQGMLNLSFEVTKPNILGVIIIGGALLLFIQNVLLMKAGKAAYRR